jgi:hypothetical protein
MFVNVQDHDVANMADGEITTKFFLLPACIGTGPGALGIQARSSTLGV